MSYVIYSDDLVKCGKCGKDYGSISAWVMHACLVENKITVKFKKLHPDAVAPSRKTEGAAGWDLCALSGETPCGVVRTLRTGIAVEIPPGYEGQLRLRSSLGMRGISIPHGMGTIDHDYRGELLVPVLRNTTYQDEIQKGDRIAQLVIHKLPDVVFEEVEELSETARGTGGFGSTGR